MNTHTISEERFEKILQRVGALQQKGKIDLSLEEDLSIGVMNLISLEEHFVFTGAKTKKNEYFDMIEEVRSMRKELMAQLMDTNEGETWCIAKHLLATTMRLIEVGTKLQNEKKKDEARAMFSRAYKIYALFWALRLKLIDTKAIKKIEIEKKSWTVEDLVNKLVDCCDE